MRDVTNVMIFSSVSSISFIIMLLNIQVSENLASESQAIFQLPVYIDVNVNAMQKSPATHSHTGDKKKS